MVVSSNISEHKPLQRMIAAGFTMFIVPALICSVISMGIKLRLLAKNIAARRADLSTHTWSSQRSSLGGLDFCMLVERFKLHTEQKQILRAQALNQVGADHADGLECHNWHAHACGQDVADDLVGRTCSHISGHNN